jgi:hypothetical protein
MITKHGHVSFPTLLVAAVGACACSAHVTTANVPSDSAQICAANCETVGMKPSAALYG